MRRARQKTVGQIPTNYKQGPGTIVSGTTPHKATLAAYACGIVDRALKLSNEYGVHYIGVNWPTTPSSTRTSKWSPPTTEAESVDDPAVPGLSW